LHFTTGTLREVVSEDGNPVGRLDVGGAITRVSLALLPDAKVGDVLLAHAGVALSRVEQGGVARAVDR